VSELDIARVVGIDPKTLRKHYREELDTGAIKATAKVAGSCSAKPPPKDSNASPQRSSG
jgi:hypothetical protein